MELLELKNRFMRFYGKYESYLYPAIKFVIAFFMFEMININIGYMERISKLPIALVLALVCAILPTYSIIWVSAFLVLLDMYALSLEVAITTLVLFAVIFFLYFRFSPKDGILAILTPICFKLRIPYIMPVACGLLKTIYSVIAVVCGTVLYYFIAGIHQNAASLMRVASEEENTMASKFSISVGQLLNNKEMYLVIGVFIVTTIVVYLVRMLKVEYAWMLAIVSGVLIELVGLFVGYLILGIPSRTLWLLIGCVISFGISLLLKFLFMNLDYARTERVQFEDDDYYYYVKAVPKKMVATKEVTVKHFGNTSSMGKRIDRSTPVLSEEQKAASRKVMAKELDIDEDLLK